MKTYFSILVVLCVFVSGCSFSAVEKFADVIKKTSIAKDYALEIEQGLEIGKDAVKLIDEVNEIQQNDLSETD